MTNKIRVLIVDDDPEYVHLIKRQLVQFSGIYDVEAECTFYDGQQAIHEGRHDIYLVDHHLDNEQTGIALIKDATMQSRPLILLTAHEDDTLREQAIVNGAAEFLIKRLVTAELLNLIIHNTLGRRHRVGELLKRQDVLTKLVSRDPLTGLVNRLALKHRIDALLATDSVDGAMIYIDLDGFKPVNDQFGHTTGDRVLQEVSARLVDTVRPGDIVGRLGGDEFLIFVSIAKSDDEISKCATIVARKLLQTVARPIAVRLPDQTFVESISISASIGIALSPADANDYAELVRLADHAMYCAKRLGKNQFSLRVEADDQAAEQWFAA